MQQCLSRLRSARLAESVFENMAIRDSVVLEEFSVPPKGLAEPCGVANWKIAKLLTKKPRFVSPGFSRLDANLTRRPAEAGTTNSLLESCNRVYGELK
jgi:hypothetical protein